MNWAGPALDHLVVYAASLDEGAAWCECTLGLPPGPGGQHPLMGTHNRLLAIDGPLFAGAYLEIIAIDSIASHGQPAVMKRWFDMDFEPLKAAVAAQGPQLSAWVARVPDAAASAARLAAAPLSLDPGAPRPASRPTPQGELRWTITLRPDGQRQLGGCLPTLITWGDQHPSQRLAPGAVRLQALALHHPEATRLAGALAALGLGAHPGLSVVADPAPRLLARLETPLGPLTLASPLLP